MGGTILNVITVLIGSALGLLIGNRLSQRIQSSVITGLGLVTLVVGMGNAGQTGNILIPLLSIASGAIIGELLALDAALERLGGWLQSRLAGRPRSAEISEQSGEAGASEARRERFINGFVTASLVFCIGPLTFVGAIQDGMGLPSGFQQLAIKSVLDGFAALAFAATLGIGVAFSIVTIVLVQGGLALAGMITGDFMTPAMVNEMTAVGGLLLIGIALILLDLKKPRVANFLPALVIAPLLVVIGEALGINLYPL